jgi:hypothetical protein
MAWPPGTIAADKTNSTTAEDDHAPHHNALAGAINDLVGHGPVGSTTVRYIDATFGDPPIYGTAPPEGMVDLWENLGVEPE